eukprot:GHVS01004070.1.p1 GENE.GHVS01004070.1~~GHVS01004070.1.p1  ORF type:complete len:653 (+),score=145.80 GHVS01004070.1:83-2041(+)
MQGRRSLTKQQQQQQPAAGGGVGGRQPLLPSTSTILSSVPSFSSVMLPHKAPPPSISSSPEMTTSSSSSSSTFQRDNLRPFKMKAKKRKKNKLKRNIISSCVIPSTTTSSTTASKATKATATTTTTSTTTPTNTAGRTTTTTAARGGGGGGRLTNMTNDLTTTSPSSSLAGRDVADSDRLKRKRSDSRKGGVSGVEEEEEELNKRHCDEQQQLPPVWHSPEGKEGLQFYDRLHEEVVQLVSWLALTPVEMLDRLRVVGRVQLVAQTLWPTAEAVPFGSLHTGLCLPEGDIDMCIYNASGGRRNKLKVMASHLVKCKVASPVSVKVVSKAKVPLVKYSDAVCAIPVDISFDSPGAAETSEFIRTNLERYPNLRPLIILNKLILLQRGLNQTYYGGVGSYLLFVMCLRFLQHIGESEGQALARNGNLGYLFLKFLHFYGCEFRYAQMGLSVLGDGSFFDKVNRRWSYKNVDSQVAAENPLDTDIDLGRSVHKMGVVANIWQEGYQMLMRECLKHNRQRTYSHRRQSPPPVNNRGYLLTIIDHNYPLFFRRRLNPLNCPPPTSLWQRHDDDDNSPTTPSTTTTATTTTSSSVCVGALQPLPTVPPSVKVDVVQELLAKTDNILLPHVVRDYLSATTMQLRPTPKLSTHITFVTSD